MAGLQVPFSSPDPSRDIAAALLAVAEAAPGTYREVTSQPGEGPRLQDILDLEPAHEKVFFLSQLPIRAQFRRLAVEELAAKFRFSPRQIELACRQAVGLAGLEGEGTISSREMHQCCYRQVVQIGRAHV